MFFAEDVEIFVDVCGLDAGDGVDLFGDTMGDKSGEIASVAEDGVLCESGFDVEVGQELAGCFAQG